MSNIMEQLEALSSREWEKLFSAMETEERRSVAKVVGIIRNVKRKITLSWYCASRKMKVFVIIVFMKTLAEMLLTQWDYVQSL